MKYIKNLFGLLLFTLFASCSDDKVPVDANDNYITSVTLVSSENTYEAVITENTITVTVPYNVSLDGAKASFIYTPSAKILPDPNTITDWDIERTFRVTSYNGDIREYSYVVIKDEIRSEGDVELKNSDDIAKFVATGTTVVTGNLIIGSDAEDAEEITDISSLNLLKEVQGNVIIKKSYIGGTLTGLDNLTTIGGLEIGTEEQPNTNDNLELISLAKLNNCAGSISVFGSGVKIIEFKELETVNDIIEFNKNTKLQSISLPKLHDAGAINFKVLPRDFSTLELPELETVNGDLNIEGIFGDVHTGGMMIATGNTGLTSISGLNKLAIVKGTLSIQNFEELQNLSCISNTKQLGGLNLYRNHKISSVDLSRIDFTPFNAAKPLIRLYNNKALTSVSTKEDLSEADCQIYTVIGIDFNFKKINNLKLESLATNLNLPLEYVTGDVLIETSASEIKIPSLTKVDGYLSIESSSCNSLSLPEIEEVGGQLYFSTNYMASINFNKLKNICCSATPHYLMDGPISASYNIEALSLATLAPSNIVFPSLTHVGGKGISIAEPLGFDCPNLKDIDGSLYLSGFLITHDNLKFNNLDTLHGLKFLNCMSYQDFSMFAKYVNNGQIAADNWSVSGCAYNPSYQDMKDGKYKPE